ncbi:hypothetical protein D9756_006525 [Leucocoprinus leucothites]|uniref:ADF-H domain-containing protein n=1 Tax=Leucocoprinus leucothites TaxID=201217 RepID=A0A8H5G2D1_9AGAR|nr:hypothetical protein D9756_006525 [Leucoagaricus leucothites]
MADDIVNAYNDVRDDKKDINWLLIDYESDRSDKLKLTKTGSGGLAELKDNLEDSRASYAYVRVKYSNDKESVREKFILVISVHTADVKAVLRVFSIEVPAKDHDDLKEEPIIVKLRKSSNLHTMSPPKYSAEDSELISDLFALSKRSPKLVRSTVYPVPGAPNTSVRSWKMNEFKYYDIPSPFPTLARGLFTTEFGEPQSAEEADLFEKGEGKYRIVWEALEMHTTPPYTLSLKSNGCIIFIAALTPQKLLVTSKHAVGPMQGVELTHSQAGEKWVRKYLEKAGKTEEDLAKRLWDENWTAVAELCDDSFEEHVLAYPPERTGLHLHGLNISCKSFKTMPHELVDAFADEWGFIKTRTHTVNSIAEVKTFTDHISNVGEWEGEAVEGFVVRTHVSHPPTSGRNSKSSTAESKGRSPYTPGSSFFFKVKFDEPYMMYRDWREVTKSLLTHHSKGQSLSAKNLPKGKMKRVETKVYVKWLIEEIRKNREEFDGYQKGHGIIRNRERFLAWYEEHKGRKIGAGSGTEEGEVSLSDLEEASEASEGEGSAKVIIVPVAIPGCGKTSVALALVHLFGWGHTQSDDIKAKKSAPVFIQNVHRLLKKHDVVIADKNNHLKQHRTQLHELASKFKPPARLIALNWSFSHLSPPITHQICSDRIISRGTNHQTLVPSDPSSKKTHQQILWMFLNAYEELTPSEVDASIDLELSEDSELEEMVAVAVDGLFKVKSLVGEGGVLEGVEKPDVARIREVVSDVIGGYQVRKGTAKEKVVEEKEVQKQQKQQAKPPRYFGLVPDFHLRKFVDSVLSGQDAVDPERIAGAEFFQTLKSAGRVTEAPHITIVHKKQLPQDQNIWDQCTEVTAMGQPPKFDCRIGHILWDDRVMVLAVDDVQPAAEWTFSSGEARVDAEKQGKEFLSVVPEETRSGLHVTVGTLNGSILPVEGKTLVERWRAGEKEGIRCVEFDEAVITARLKGLWSSNGDWVCCMTSEPLERRYQDRVFFNTQRLGFRLVLLRYRSFAHEHAKRWTVRSCASSRQKGSIILAVISSLYSHPQHGDSTVRFIMPTQLVLVTPENLRTLTVGLVIQALLNGGLLTLGIMCLSLLSETPNHGKDRESRVRPKAWKWFILVLLGMNIFYLTMYCLNFVGTIMGEAVSWILEALLYACPMLILCLTDGVLVWRCYMVTNALGPQVKFQQLFWIFPLCVYLVTVGGHNDLSIPHLWAVLSLSTNAVLNVYAAAFISIRLLTYQRLITRARLTVDTRAPQTPQPSPAGIMQIFLESAAINVPLALTAAVVIFGSDWILSTSLACIGVPCQSFATILILHQVASGKATNKHQYAGTRLPRHSYWP